MKIFCLFNIENILCSNSNDYIMFAEEIFNCIDLTITDCSFDYMNENKKVFKNFKYTSKNLKKISDINVGDTKFVIFLNSKKEGLPPYNIRCEINIRTKVNTSNITVVYESSLKPNSSLIDEYEKISSIVKKYFSYNLAFMDKMPKEKQPEIFISGFLAEPLTLFEKEIAYAISCNLSADCKKILFLFRVNCIKADEVIFKEIQKKYKGKYLQYCDNFITFSFEDDLPEDMQRYSECYYWSDIFEMLKSYNYINFVWGIVKH